MGFILQAVPTALAAPGTPILIAIKIGVPGAARAVGTACKMNPIPLFIPCHRVVKHDGSIGEFALGKKNKEFLLKMESK